MNLNQSLGERQYVVSVMRIPKMGRTFLKCRAQFQRLHRLHFTSISDFHDWFHLCYLSQEAPPCQRVLRLYLLPRDSRVEIIHCPVVFEQFKLGFVIVPYKIYFSSTDYRMIWPLIILGHAALRSIAYPYWCILSHLSKWRVALDELSVAFAN